MLPLCETHRIRCVAVDRRGFGKSEWSGTPGSSITETNYDTFAKDTAQVLEELDLKKIIFVAASMGCGETLLAYFGSKWVRERCKVRNDNARGCQHSRRDCDR
jgi:non-heme chloroperoxidase